MSRQIKNSTIEPNLMLGIEFGSTRIKAVLINESHQIVAVGAHTWENQLVDGIWTYGTEDIWSGLQDCYKDLTVQYKRSTGEDIHTLSAIGFSGMMHGYLAFDENDNLLVPFRTWRNTCTGKAAEELSKLFQFNIPQRWSIAHLYQAILDQEPHVADIQFFTTLAGYIHFSLTGERVLGIGEASGMFPIDSKTENYNAEMIRKFDERSAQKGFTKKLAKLLPRVLSAGECAGHLTEKGALLLDPTGTLQPGIPFCPPEGDAGTGMVATNSVKVRTGNVSAGTSIFAMAVLEQELSEWYTEIDMVTTPDGKPVAMVHCNNCTSEINAWVSMLKEFAEAIGSNISEAELYPLLFRKALEGAADCDGVIACGYLSGEPVVGLENGCPLLVRKPGSRLNLPNLMRSQIYASVATLKIGMDLLMQRENVQLDRLTGHGGLFKTPGVGQRFLAAAVSTPVSVMETAGEGGAWGMALLAAYMKKNQPGELLPDYLNQNVFGEIETSDAKPEETDMAGFKRFMTDYQNMLDAERAACKSFK